MKLLRIEEIERQEEYWDLEIEDNHNFYANNILVHNSNAGFAYTREESWFQSRNNIITIEKDNAGCAFMMTARQEIFENMINELAMEYSIDLDKKGIVLYMELAGGNIQKKSCFSGTDKLFTVFQRAKVFNIEPTLDNEGNEEANYWIETKVNDTWLENSENRIFNVMALNSREIEIDFERPDLAQNELVKLVEEMEMDSEAGHKLGLKDTISEGYVASFEYKGSIQIFKIKGEKHSAGSGKVKALKSVDSVLVQKQIDFVNDYACKSFRLNQAWQECFGIENEKMEPTNKMTGDFLRLVIADVWKEELDIALELGLEVKPLNGLISKSARQWFLSELDREAGISL